MRIRQLEFVLFALIFSFNSNGQTLSSKSTEITESIPSHIREEQRWWNLQRYSVAVTPDYKQKFIKGTNSITFLALQAGRTLQIDLQEPMRITRVIWKETRLAIKKSERNTYLVTFPNKIKAGEKQTITVHFKGQPQEALNPPFDNGWIWTKDEKGRPWISVACQGSGASIWLPCKDVLYDEPDHGVDFSITVPDTLTAVANGKLQGKLRNKKGTATYTWQVINPINNYSIIPYIGKYVSWHDDYVGLKGKLSCDFWVLDYNLKKAKTHLKQTDTMLHAFEYWMGPYPFYEDGYKLVEAPMPGMEHQSAVAHGNGFQNGYRGKDFISESGWGLRWDFMLVHESGHEWFGNSVTSSNYGETWIHEGFTKYLETLYTAFVFGLEAGNAYALGTWKRIKNDLPILGTNTSDKYYKGSAMLHMIRQILGDTIFRGWLQGLQQAFYHQTVTTKQILAFLNQYTKLDFSKMFAQYLQTTQIPVLEYSFQDGEFLYRWTNCVEGFAMPVSISVDSKTYKLVYPTTQWQKLTISETGPINLSVDNNFLVQVKRLSESE